MKFEKIFLFFTPTFVFYLCSFVFHLCSFVFHLCSFVFTCVPLVWCFRSDPPISDNDNCSFESLARIIRKIDAESKKIIQIGDTNCDFKSPEDSNSGKLKLIYSEFQFEQKITEYTRVATYTAVIFLFL